VCLLSLVFSLPHAHLSYYSPSDASFYHRLKISLHPISPQVLELRNTRQGAVSLDAGYCCTSFPFLSGFDHDHSRALSLITLGRYISHLVCGMCTLDVLPRPQLLLQQLEMTHERRTSTDIPSNVIATDLRPGWFHVVCFHFSFLCI